MFHISSQEYIFNAARCYFLLDIVSDFLLKIIAGNIGFNIFCCCDLALNACFGIVSK